MKKMFLTVALLIATMMNISAKNSTINKEEVKNETIENFNKVIASADTSFYVVSFYNIERLVIKNDSNVNIKVYDKNWNLIIDTNKTIDEWLNGGNYYIASACKIKTKYVECLN